MELKIGRKIFNIDDKDLILDNGSCYQLITKEIKKGFDSYSPIISKKLFNNLKKCGLVFTNENLKKTAMENYKYADVTYWKFNVEQMERLGY